MTYRLYYVSADGPEPDASWSVYYELYASASDDEPIDGTQLFVDRLDSEGEAREYADILQRNDKRTTDPNERI